MRDRPRIAVVTFPGSNDDGDAALALEGRGADVVRAWHADSELPDSVGGVLLPGGFSYGDYLRCGAIAGVAPITRAIVRFAAEGGFVLGICNGFQILCEAGLLPGALRFNRQLEFVCRDVDLVVETSRSPFTERCAVGERLTIPIKHGEGNWYADEALLTELEADERVVLRYADDVNGAVGRVAGVLSEERNVMGLMPHPEHAVDPLLGPIGGIPLLDGFVAAAASRQLIASS